MASQDTINRVMVMLTAAYPRMQVPADTARVYAELLGDIDDQMLITAAKQAVATNKWFPTVAELRGTAIQIQGRANGLPNVAEAWGEVMTEVSRVGYVASPTFSHPVITEAVSAMGGWHAVCMSTNAMADRAHFLRLYEALSKRTTDDMAMLPEVRTLTEQLAGTTRQQLEAAP